MRPFRPTPGRQCGFSLLEVLVAFAILALSLGVLMQIFSASGRAASLGDRYARAAELAESRLALVGTEYELIPSSFGDEEAGFSWQVDISDYSAADLQQPPEQYQAYQVAVTVSWQQGLNHRKLVLDSLRLQRLRP